MSETQTISPALSVDIRLALAEGFGFGSGSISYRSGKSQVNVDDLVAAIKSQQIITPIDVDDGGKPLDDDGCGDGRPVGRVTRGKITYKRSLNRAKVFGGGATMATAGLIATGMAGGLSLHDAFGEALKQLHTHQLNYGAHTDSHSTDNAHLCGCGAIDKAPIILQNTVTYRDQIRATIAGLVGEDGLDEVLDAFAVYAQAIKSDDSYHGQDVIEYIAQSGAVVKDLSDDHRELYVVLNYVQGYTVDQQYVRGITDGQGQVFGVDVWRLQQIADRTFGPQSRKALLGELVYTLATAATLTAGDLPVYVVRQINT